MLTKYKDEKMSLKKKNAESICKLEAVKPNFLWKITVLSW